jgi:hypothetical protein
MFNNDELELIEKIMQEIKEKTENEPVNNNYKVTEISLTFSSYDLFTLNDILFKLKNQ